MFSCHNRLSSGQFALICAVLLSAAPAALAQAPDPLSPLDRPAETAPAAAAPSNFLNKADLEFYVRHLYVWAPRVKVEISDPKPSDVEGLLELTVAASYQLARQERTFYVSKDGKHIIEGTNYTVDKNPFHEAIDGMDTSASPAFGKEGAPVKIVVYSDFQCPFCAQEATVVHKQVAEKYPDDVRVYFRDFPLTTIHKWAMPGAIRGQCVYQQNPQLFWDYHDWIFEKQKEITPENIDAKVNEFLAGRGIDALKLGQCTGDSKTADAIEDSLKEGRAVGVTSTPTMFVNGRKLTGSVRWEQLQQIIDFEIEYQKVAKNAGDDCGCSIGAEFPAAQ
jgi:protein-disulfide isomerase